MPEPDYAWLPRESILDFEEIAVLVDAFASVGTDRVRITGGEPLLRRNLTRLIELLAARSAIRDLALTTNGVLLADQAAALRAAGLHRITVSLDTLKRDRFQALARFDELTAVLAGIAAASRVFGTLKIDTVVMRGRNDDELTDLIAFGRTVNAEVRFIEYMDVGGATGWSMDAVFSKREMLEVLSRTYGPIEPLAGRESAPAERFRLHGRHDVRDHRVDDGALLWRVRSQPAHGGWPVAALSLRARRARSAASAARGRQPRGTRPSGRDRVVDARGSRRGGTPGITGPRRPHPGGGAEARQASRDAHARRLAAHRDDRIDTRGPPRRHGSGEHTGRRQNPGNHRHGRGIARRNLEQHRPQE